MNMHVLLAGKFHNFATRETLLWERDCVLLVCGIGHFSCVQLLATLWSVAHQAYVHGFSRQEYWNGFPCPPPGDLPNPEIKPTSLTYPA